MNRQDELEKLPTDKELDILDSSIAAADPRFEDVLIKDLRFQINKMTKKVRQFKTGYSSSLCDIVAQLRSNQSASSQATPKPVEGDGWIRVEDDLPKLNIEYNVAWDVDGGELVTTTMEFNVESKSWYDVINGGLDVTEYVKYWRELPTPPQPVNT